MISECTASGTKHHLLWERGSAEQCAQCAPVHSARGTSDLNGPDSQAFYFKVHFHFKYKDIIIKLEIIYISKNRWQLVK